MNKLDLGIVCVNGQQRLAATRFTTSWTETRVLNARPVAPIQPLSRHIVPWK